MHYSFKSGTQLVVIHTSQDFSMRPAFLSARAKTCDSFTNAYAPKTVNAPCVTNYSNHFGLKSIYFGYVLTVFYRASCVLF